MKEFTYNDIPISDFSVITEPNPVTGEIKQITKIAGSISEKIYKTQADQLRNALIDLGWVPPIKQRSQPVFPADLVEANEQDAKVVKIYGVPLCDLRRSDLMVLAVDCVMKYEEMKHERANHTEKNPAIVQ